MDRSLELAIDATARILAGWLQGRDLSDPRQVERQMAESFSAMLPVIRAAIRREEATSRPSQRP